MVEDLATPNTQEQSAPGTAKRARSTIEFPYADLDDAVELAAAIAGHYGSECTTDQLAPQLHHDSTVSGAFRARIAASRMFGVVTVNREVIALTPLGWRIVQPQTEAVARGEAFLRVPLYRAIFDRFRGGLLPPDIAIENEMKRLGVVPKQAEKARQAFQRSARQAGYFAHGTNRLVPPPGVSLSGTPEPPPSDIAPLGDESRPNTQEVAEPGSNGMPRRSSGGGSGGSGGWEPPSEDMLSNPLLKGLFQVLPPPGASWPDERRKTWLQTAEGIFNLIYKD